MTPRFRARLRLFRRCALRFLFHHVLHADDPPHRLALGIAIGMFVTFTPTIGFQMALTVFFAWLLGANKVVGIVLVWLSNPVTILPIFYFCYRIGHFLVGGERVNWRWWAQLARPPVGWWASVQFYWERFMHLAAPLWIGSLIVATLVAYAAYYVSYYAICGYRLKRWGTLLPPSARRERHGSRPRQPRQPRQPGQPPG